MTEAYAPGALLRYGDALTALMQVTYVSPGQGGVGPRYYGLQCLGGYIRADHHQVKPVNAADREIWAGLARSRAGTPRRDDAGIVRAAGG